MRSFSFIHRYPVLCLVLMFLSAVMLSTLPGCGETASVYQKSYKVLSGSKITMEALAKTAKDLHEGGALTDEQGAKAEEAYMAAKIIQKEFISIQSEAILSGDGTKQEQAARLGVSFMVASTKFINLAIQLGLIKSDDPGITTVESAVPG